MTSMIIEYDLRSPGRNYDELYKEIRSYDVWARITESTWFIKTGESCAQVRDKLMTMTASLLLPSPEQRPGAMSFARANILRKICKKHVNCQNPTCYTTPQ